MPSDIKDQFKAIKQQIIQGKYQTALKEIEELVKKKEIENKDRLYCLVLQSDIKNDLGDHKKALELAKQVLEESKEADGILLQAAASQHKAVALLFLTGEKEEALNCLESGLELLEEIPDNVPKSELSEQKGWLLTWKGTIIRMFGDFDKGYEIMNKALFLAEESGNKRLLSRFYSFLGFLYHEKFEYKKMEDSLIKARKIAEELDNKFLLALAYLYFAILHSRRRLPSQAIKSSKKGLKLLEEIGSTFGLSGWFSNLSNQFQATSQFDEALHYKRISLETGNLQKNSAIFGMANIYVLKNDFEKAHEYYMKSLQLSEEIKDYRVLTFSLYKLVEITLLQDNYLLAKQYLKQLKHLQKDPGFEFITLYYRVANVLVLKESSKFSDWGKAITELQSLLADEDLDSHTRIQALYWLLELRIKELQISITKESLEEVKKQTIRLEVVAKEERRRGFLFGAYRLQSQLALIELDAKQAVEFLEKAQVIADEMNYEFYHFRLNEDREKLKQQLTMLQELQEKQTTMEEVIKLVSLGTTIQSIKEEAVIEERDEETGEIIEYRKLFALKL
ncbi:MAG: hypothetical protein FK733_10150 [Asgard group archaeon]|nr:hypothetical protein [Asgard group archaeon]